VEEKITMTQSYREQRAKELLLEYSGADGFIGDVPAFCTVSAIKLADIQISKEVELLKRIREFADNVDEYCTVGFIDQKIKERS
jgi:hypothetical protein